MKLPRFSLDALGMCASSLCLVHCLALPLLIMALPLLSFATDTTSTDSAAEHSATCTLECCAAEAGGEGEATTAACCSTPTDFWIHVGLLATVAPLGIVAWGGGYLKHRRFGVLGLGLLGVLLLAGALLFGMQFWGGRGEQVMTVAGSICMVSAHLWNRRLCRCCSSPDLANVVELETAAPQSQPVSLPTGDV